MENEKKIDVYIFYYYFSSSWKCEKKMKRKTKKINLVQTELGYCPICIVTGRAERSGEGAQGAG